MVQVENLSKEYGDRVLFSDVTFHIGRRERCAIIGRNGSGKSTLIKILAGIEHSDGGNVHFPKGLRVGALPQHLHFNLPTILEEAVLGLPEHLREETYRAEIILSGLGFSEEDFFKPPESFSGGYQLRLALCKVLVGEPDLLLLDEPTNYLDILAIRWLENFLRSWHGQIVFISHDRAFVNALCTHIIGIKRGKVTKIEGKVENYLSLIEIHEETHERTREKLEKKKAHMRVYIEKFGAKATKAKQAQSRMKAIDKMGEIDALQEEQLLHFEFHYKQIANKRLFNIDALQFSYDKQAPLIHDLSFELEKGERLAIIGKNGSGKSTLLRLLIGELSPVSGGVSMGKNTEYAYFGQTNIDRLDGDKTVEEELTAAFPDASYTEIRNACGAMLFSGDDAKKRISVLSGGEKSRVLLAKILLTPTNLLLLDEPTHHLDIESVDALLHAIEQFPGAVVIISHDETLLKKLNASKLVICHEGHQEFFLGDYPLFLEKKGWEEEGPKKEVKSSSKTERATRAQNVQELSRQLRPIRKKAETVEKALERGELEKHKLEQEMLTPSDKMQGLIEKHGKLSQELDALYEELDALHQEIERIKG